MNNYMNAWLGITPEMMAKRNAAMRQRAAAAGITPQTPITTGTVSPLGALGAFGMAGKGPQAVSAARFFLGDAAQEAAERTAKSLVGDNN